MALIGDEVDEAREKMKQLGSILWVESDEECEKSAANSKEAKRTQLTNL